MICENSKAMAYYNAMAPTTPTDSPRYPLIPPGSSRRPGGNCLQGCREVVPEARFLEHPEHADGSPGTRLAKNRRTASCSPAATRWSWRARPLLELAAVLFHVLTKVATCNRHSVSRVPQSLGCDLPLI